MARFLRPAGKWGCRYRRARILVDKLNHCFRVPVVWQTGRQHGGGASLTGFGHAVVKHYRAVERAAEKAGAPYIKALSASLVEPASAGRRLTPHSGGPRGLVSD
jgi:molybdate transport system regulatory protein